MAAVPLDWTADTREEMDTETVRRCKGWIAVVLLSSHKRGAMRVMETA